MNCTKNDW